MIRPPSRYRKLYAGPNVGALLEDFYPANSIEVSGESFYKNELRNIELRLEMREDRFTQVEAFVVAEPENEFDPNAVAVYVHESKVGYINKNDAPEFSEGLMAVGGSAWVMAGLKKVTEIGQYRIRLMAQKPVALDPRVFPFVDLSNVETFIVADTHEGYKELEASDWRQKQVDTDDWIYETEPLTVLLICENAANGDSEVVMYRDGTPVFKFPSEVYFEIFDAVLEVNQLAWASISLFMTRDEEQIYCHFCPQEGTPRISDYAPKKPKQDLTPWGFQTRQQG